MVMQFQEDSGKFSAVQGSSYTRVDQAVAQTVLDTRELLVFYTNWGFVRV